MPVACSHVRSPAWLTVLHHAQGRSPAQNFTLSSTFSAKGSLTGAASSTSGSPTSFALAYDSSYETAVPLVSLAGTYVGSAGTLSGVGAVTLTVLANGNYSGVSEGCLITGTLRSRGTTSIFDMTVATDAATCGESITASGIAGLAADGTSLIFAMVQPNREDAVFGVVAAGI